ncbi:MAG: hypothetical protein JJE30_04105 [Desulfuromonadales bacterium]|nr:hypothetical protein [Desulfuromonadales bacterium]
MTSKALHISQIQHDLYLLPIDKLQEARDFIEFLCNKAAVPKPAVVKLEGIWQGKGFEKLSLESELKSAREQVAESIMNKAS